MSEFFHTLIECAQAGGRILLDHFGRVQDYTVKESKSSIVTAADVASERRMVEIIRARYPRHSIVAEETGCARQDSEFTWVVDPLDGTSNFAVGIPWFGVLLALLHNGEPVLAAMHLPVSGTLYLAEKGGGVRRDGEPVRVSSEIDLKNILCAFDLDASASQAELDHQARLLASVAGRVRNVRATNCLVDLCHTVDGRFGACICLNAKIWDIAAVTLMLPEAGGCLTDWLGEPIRFRLDQEPFDRNYTIVGANPELHRQLLELLRPAAA